MQNSVAVVLVGVVVLAVSFCSAQEVHMYAPRGQGGMAIPDGGEGSSTAEVQDEQELASALGVDQRALYEDLMRIQQELGGSPLAEENPAMHPLGPMGMGEQSSQENEDY